MGQGAQIAEAVTGLDPITLQIVFLAACVTIVVIAVLATLVISKVVARAKTARFKNGTGEMELRFHDVAQD